VSCDGAGGSGRTIYLMRHGDSRPDAVRRFVGRSDHPLNETGRAQARWWHRELSSAGIERVYCCDLARSAETARIVGQGVPEPAVVVPELREIDLGQWDGMPIAEVRTRYPEQYASRGRDLVGYRPPDGESFADLAERVLPAFDEVVRRSRGNVLVVGHAGVNRVILCHLLGMPLANLFRVEQEYGCMNVLVLAEGSWAVRRLNAPARVEQDSEERPTGAQKGAGE
jgi:alpha-ribazole phosphatase